MDLEKKEIQKNIENNSESFPTFVETPGSEVFDASPEVVVEETGVVKSKSKKTKKDSKISKENKDTKSVEDDETKFEVSVGYPLEISDDDNEWRKALVEKRVAA